MQHPLKLLLIEDSPDDAMLVVHQLSEGGFDVTYKIVETPQAFSAALAEGDWDIILADYSLPSFSAPKAFEILQQRNAEIPFLIVSGSTEDEVIIPSLKAGAKDFLSKDRLGRLVPAIERELLVARDRKAKRLAEERERLRDLFIATLTHDLRVPVIAQQRMLIALEKELDLHQTPTTTQLYHALVANNAELLALINQLLEMHQLESGKVLLNLESVDLAELICDCLVVFQTGASENNKNIHFELALAEDLPFVCGDKVLLRRLFTNLIANAIEHSVSGGTIGIRGARQGNVVCVAVADNGEGIPEDIKAQIFAPYFSRRQTGRQLGAGLGLYSCKMIVELHAGNIQVESQPGEGSTFLVELPVSLMPRNTIGCATGETPHAY